MRTGHAPPGAEWLEAPIDFSSSWDVPSDALNGRQSRHLTQPPWTHCRSAIGVHGRAFVVFIRGDS
jgi:hypothetical protein